MFSLGKGESGRLVNRWISNSLIGDEPRAEQLASVFSEAAKMEAVPVHIAVAMGKHEGDFDSGAVSSHGAEGIMQLHPKWWGKSWKTECLAAGVVRLSNEACERLNVKIGLQALRYYKKKCGTWLKAIGAYRSGKCIVGPKGEATMRLARKIRALTAAGNAGEIARGEHIDGAGE